MPVSRGVGFLMAVGVSLGAHALTGIGDSGVNPLETVSPSLQMVSALTERSLSVAFSEPMRTPSVATPGNYAVSGAGIGTLDVSPASVLGAGLYTLTWTAGEMRNGAGVTVTAANLQDVVGNPIDPAHNSASGTGLGIAPVFSNVLANPAQAAAGDIVTVTFTASETLEADPDVTVNGHAATWLGGISTDFAYSYMVQASDPSGMAAVAVTGADLAGNPGSLNDNAALEIVEAQAGLPLHLWPLIAGVALAAVAVLARRKRLGVLLLIAALLASSAALAASPSVSNVTFTQGPNASGTQVDIYYDLVAPNGPCAIMLSLSKNGGAEGFIHPMAHYSGDIANVATGAGKHIVWDIRADYPEEDLPQARIRVTADDALVQHTLTYAAGPNGSISGASSQTVNHGADGTAVSATPDTGYHFIQWSDGSTQNPRTDTGVTADISVTASFEINTYTLTYMAGANGSISGDSPQTVNYGGNGSLVTAVPDTGYHFVQWSDGYTGAERLESFVIADLSVMATFAINTYTLTYTAGANGSISGDSPQTVNYGNNGTQISAVPDTGYHFVQWSDSIPTAARIDTNVTADIAVTAIFAINTYTLTYTAGANGAISGASPQTVNYGGSGTAVTAVPNSGYAFAQWSDGVLTAARTDTNVMADISVSASFVVLPAVTWFAINGGADTTMPLSVTLDNTATNGPTQYMASESPAFTGAVWAAYSTAPSFTLSFGVGTRTVYFKVCNADGESVVASDTIFLVPNTVPVAAGTFMMGRSASGDDAQYGNSSEDPQHAVTLGAYQIGKWELTNKEYCDVLNWANAQGYLKTNTGAAWTGATDIYAGGPSALYKVVPIRTLPQAVCGIQYSGGLFSSRTRVGLPGATSYSMDRFPMQAASWYGSVAFCNWLSQWQGLTPCYNMNAWNWPLAVRPPTSGGYRLPTEAEWECAAAWDGSKRWIYGFMSDTNSSNNRCNYYWYNGSAYECVNPVGFTAMPCPSPVGWFDGNNVSPNGNVPTVNSPSPAGAYDMSGNVQEWCQDWYLSTYYASGGPPWNNPTGPASGTGRVTRGGCYSDRFRYCRSAYRTLADPTNAGDLWGARLVRSTLTSAGVTTFYINDDDATTMNLSVTLNNTCWGTPTQYMASESFVFTGTVWTAYSTAPSFTLSFGVGKRTVFFKVRYADGEESGVASDTIFLVPNTVSVAAGTFTMGRTDAGDDATDGLPEELPTHSVTLGAYRLGKGETTNKEYCDVLNWAKAQGYLYSNAAGTPWPGSGNIYAGGTATSRYEIVGFTSTDCNIQYSGGVFTSKSRVGLPGTTNYSMDTHPVVCVSWYGSIAFCNWLSQWQGLTPCYDMNTALWPLTLAPPTQGGYRLPTEAEWERAAAWDGSKHWIYGFTSDTLTGRDRCNYIYSSPNNANPLGLTTIPLTSPDAWFDGGHVSPNGSVTTADSVSPVGAYDMSGNVLEWCQDWYLSTYYTSGGPPWNNPIGPADGTQRVQRGGSWWNTTNMNRTAMRDMGSPGVNISEVGFRVAKS